MVVDVTAVFTEYLAANRGPDPTDPTRRQRPDYCVSATLTGADLDVVLTFRTGSAYCCFAWGCHLDLLNGKRWDGFRRRLRAASIEALPRMELRLTVVVESGS